MPGAVGAIFTLAFFRDRREHFRRIHLAELMKHESVCDRLFERREDRRIDRANHDSTSIRLQDYVLAVLFRDDGAAAIDASGPMRN
jgi:hypothetical protein